MNAVNRKLLDTAMETARVWQLSVATGSLVASIQGVLGVQLLRPCKSTVRESHFRVSECARDCCSRLI